MRGGSKHTVHGIVSKLLAMLDHDYAKGLDREELLGFVDDFRFLLLGQVIAEVFRRDMKPRWRK